MNNNILGIFLLLLAVCGNFIAETLGCKSQKLLQENMLAKNIIIILITYFSLGLSNADKVVSPLVNLRHALMVWSGFIIFNKMSIQFTLFSFLLLTIKLVIYNYIDYFKKTGNIAYNQGLESTYNILLYLNVFTIIIGFILYFRKQYKEHSKGFSIIKFLFGVSVCDYAKK